jgi:multidrug resistance efflux pump
VESASETLDLANGNLEAAQAYLDDLLNGPDTTDLQLADAQVWVASAEQAAAQAYLNLLLAGPRPESISVSEAQMMQAQAALDAAEAKRDKAILRAPFDGIISDITIRANEWANPGQQIALMAASGGLEVETTDLNEIDVARVREGDTVSVTFDALPGVTVSGKVLSIASRSSEGAGVNYTVRISLDEIPDALRWGMTAFVDIDVSE